MKNPAVYELQPEFISKWQGTLVDSGLSVERVAGRFRVRGENSQVFISTDGAFLKLSYYGWLFERWRNARLAKLVDEILGRHCNPIGSGE